ncbi:septum formation family protein [Nonomuraea sp. NPDC002799]
MVRLSLAATCLIGALVGCTAPLETAGPAAAHYHATELRPGDCVEPLPVDAMVNVVSCEMPHAAEFATTYVLADGPWPGLEETQRLALDGCGPLMRYVEARKHGLEVVPILPAEEFWPRQRTAYCLAAPSDGEPLTGRVIK